MYPCHDSGLGTQKVSWNEQMKNKKKCSTSLFKRHWHTRCFLKNNDISHWTKVIKGSDLCLVQGNMRDSGKKSSQKLLVRPSLTYEAPRTQYVETRQMESRVKIYKFIPFRHLFSLQIYCVQSTTLNMCTAHIDRGGECSIRTTHLYGDGN